MKVKSVFLISLLIGSLYLTNGVHAQAIIPSKTLTILYSNNINGEIDPCPT